jgi:hypothetical protein
MEEAAVPPPSALAALVVLALGDLVLKLARRTPCAAAFACEVSAERAGFGGFGGFGAFEYPTVLVLLEQRGERAGSTTVLLEQRSKRAPGGRRSPSQTCSKLLEVRAE